MLTDVPVNPALPPIPTRSFPLIATDDLDGVRRFYRDTLGCTLTYDLERYVQVQLTAAGDEGPELCFMVRPGPRFAGGAVLSVPVNDADAVQARLEAAGVPITVPVEDKPWGWRSVYVTDPTGLVLDFFHVLPTAE